MASMHDLSDDYYTVAQQIVKSVGKVSTLLLYRMLLLSAICQKCPYDDYFSKISNKVIAKLFGLLFQDTQDLHNLKLAKPYTGL